MQTLKLESKLLNFSLVQNEKLNHLLFLILGSLFIASSAQITIPIQPVPVSLQSMAALFLGMIFGPRMACKIILLYLFEGVCGLPVFADFSAGIQVLFGPTGGYLLGFLPAAVFTGYVLQKGWAKYYRGTFFAALLGTIILFIPGYFILAQYVGYHNAYLFGVAPFYITECCKLAVFTAITPFCWRSIEK